MSAPRLVAHKVLLVVHTPECPVTELEQAMAQALARLGVTAAHCEVLRLDEQPRLGARYGVRVTPCLVIDTGERLIHLPGALLELDAQSLEAALVRG